VEGPQPVHLRKDSSSPGERSWKKKEAGPGKRYSGGHTVNYQDDCLLRGTTSCGGTIMMDKEHNRGESKSDQAHVIPIGDQKGTAGES